MSLLSSWFYGKTLLHNTSNIWSQYMVKSICFWVESFFSNVELSQRQKVLYRLLWEKSSQKFNSCETWALQYWPLMKVVLFAELLTWITGLTKKILAAHIKEVNYTWYCKPIYDPMVGDVTGLLLLLFYI